MPDAGLSGFKHFGHQLPVLCARVRKAAWITEDFQRFVRIGFFSRCCGRPRLREQALEWYGAIALPFANHVDAARSQTAFHKRSESPWNERLLLFGGEHFSASLVFWDGVGDQFIENNCHDILLDGLGGPGNFSGLVEDGSFQRSAESIGLLWILEVREHLFEPLDERIGFGFPARFRAAVVFLVFFHNTRPKCWKR